jgi:hypothetical protein
MLMILATRSDQTAAWLAERWRSHDAIIASPADLSTSGWSLHSAAPGKSKAYVEGRKVRNEEISSVLTRISCVQCHELNHIVPSDREYVASEMTAFLLAWLSSLACPVLNQPTPGCLGGPALRQEGWTHLAARLGISVAPVRRKTGDRTPMPEGRSTCEVIVVGDECFGEAAPRLVENARLLARASGTALLAVRFTGPEPDCDFVSASPWPDLASPELADAALNCLGMSAC